jgi:FkbM family methyltransferase
VLEEIFARGEYNPLLDAELEGVRQIVDLGANIGLTVRLWRRSYPDARIIAVEPDQGNLALCRRNVAEAGDPNVDLVHACVAGTPRRVFLRRDQGEWAISMSDEAATGGPTVDALTMPQLLERAGAVQSVDLLKCDIEGAEQELFADCGAWIGSIRNMLIELHHPYTSAMFLDDLRSAGARFDVRKIEKSGTRALLLLQASGSRQRGEMRQVAGVASS